MEVKNGIDHCEKKEILKYVRVYILMKDSSYAKVAERFSVSTSYVRKCLTIHLPLVSTFWYNQVLKKKDKNIARSKTQLKNYKGK